MRVTEAAIFRALVAESDVWFWVQEQVGERVYRGALNLFEAACTAETARVNERYKPSMEPWDGSAAAHAALSRWIDEADAALDRWHARTIMHLVSSGKISRRAVRDHLETEFEGREVLSC